MQTSPDIDSAALLYRATCPKCRFLSAAIVIGSGRLIRRIPVDSAEAVALYARYGEGPGKLALLYRSRFRTGRAVPLSVMLALPGIAYRRIARLAHAAHGGRRAHR
jgi:hypothetical protein